MLSNAQITDHVMGWTVYWSGPWQWADPLIFHWAVHFFFFLSADLF
jgi:hypothetical protein